MKGKIRSTKRGSYRAFLFALLILGTGLRTPAFYLYYALAQEDFIERLCENKDRPELKCNGKCALSKMLAEQQGEERTPLPDIPWSQLVFIFSYEELFCEELQTIRAFVERHPLYYPPLRDIEIPPPLV